MRRLFHWVRWGLGSVLMGLLSAAHADAVDTLRDFVRDVKSGRSAFTQTVTATDGARKKTSSGQFEFLRPGRFRSAEACKVAPSSSCNR